MGETTHISWADRTWSPWYGCTQISMGEKGACVACYARQLSETRMGRVVFGGPGRGEGTRDARADPAWNDPIRWNRTTPGDFVFPSMCDPFDNHPALTDLRPRFFGLIRATPHLTWLLLTKRPGNIVKQFAEICALEGRDRERHGDLASWWPRNAAIGFTAVTQDEFDRDWLKARDAFLALGAPFVFWSGEPLMGGIILPVDFLALGSRAWAITGGETDQGAHKARPSHPDWFRSIRDQCAAAGVPYHHKQNGEWTAIRADLIPILRARQGWVHIDSGKLVQAQVEADLDAIEREERRADRSLYGHVARVGKKAAGRLLDGVVHDARPAVPA